LEHLADAAGVGPLDESGQDAESGVVVDPGHGLELAAVGQPDPAHDVQLPQLHGSGPLPAPVIALGASAGPGLDEAVADQGPVDAGQPGRWVDADPDQFVGQAALAPVGMAAAQLAQVGLDCGRHLVRAAVGPVGAVGQGIQPAGPIAAQPAVDGLAADLVALGDLEHREPVAQHLHDGVAALLCHCELQKHAPDLLTSPLVGEAQEGRAVMSTINRNSGTHQPEATAQASTGSAQGSESQTCQQSASNQSSHHHSQHRFASLQSAG
jgi:hypothetical protein